MKQQIKARVNELQNDIISSIQECIKIPSVISDATDKYPFGENIDKALRYTLDLCESLGFKTVYKDGYYGYAEIGEGEELIGILGHLDVVPEGELENWQFPPYEGILDGDKLCGRGTQDDKGPTIASIYAVKALMDLGIKFDKRIRFIFGTDEENLWRCINKYKENNEETPNYGFTPDSKFPITNAEKGLLQSLIIGDANSGIELCAGDAFNSVPGKAMYTGEYVERLKEELDKLKFEYTCEDEKVFVLGKSVHSAASDKGINAIARLCIALNNIGVKSSAVKFIAEVIGEDANANNVVKNCMDEASGKLTFNIGKIDLNKEKETVSIDVRIPVTYNKDTLVEKLEEIVDKYNLKYEEFDYLASSYVPADNFLIKVLKKVYEEETGLDGTPHSSGGATYARALDNCVAFGAVFPGSPETEHQANEFTSVKELMKATEIYAICIYELLQGK
ncbi:Sapep family Mn(2+)-dependent dipeptidase [Romboutsia maritimum]|uniref:Sapep family Mn(2+)-dependent dipeptidase n=1 Tax=Romboutsia maritimum TaxID=2020948 RepID=A0A371IUX0_9FIRM|nr:M20 family metallopeptidase [Romboutsia maritimum]RDY24274.1 Sapep family Mn(2+)-dependent dipeptidase [Romboutsia maritimum]